jgi:HK97 family phage prohead protease
MDIQTLRDRVFRRQPPTGTVTRLAPDAMPKPATDGSRRISFTYSDETVDRDNDMIRASGWVLDAYRKNPVALFGHNAGSPESVIGRSVNLKVEGGRLIGDIEFVPASVNPLAEMTYQLYRGSFLNAVSVGFAPLDVKLADQDKRPGGLDFLRQELLEISCVPVPANGNALAIARSKGIDLTPLQRFTKSSSAPGRVTQVPAGKSIPDAPEMYPFDPRGMSRGDIAQEFEVVVRWLEMAKAAPGVFSAEQQRQVNQAETRYETLWRYRFA